MSVEKINTGGEILKSSVSGIKKLTRSGDNQIQVRGLDKKTYRFFGNGRAGVLSKNPNGTLVVTEMESSQALLQKLKTLEGSKKGTLGKQESSQDALKIKSHAYRNLDNKNTNKEKISDAQLLAGLKSLVGSSQEKINNHLERNKSQYITMVNTPAFQEMFNQARLNPQQNALIIQLYAKYKLGYDRVIVTGKYNEKIQSLIQSLEDKEKTAEREKRIQERANITPELQNKKEEITYKTSKIISQSISPEDNYRYYKMFHLPDSTIDSFLKTSEKRKRPEKVKKIKEDRQKVIYEGAKKSAIKGCINYLQELFKQNIQIENKQEDLGKLFDNIDISNGITSHGQSLDFKVNLEGRPFSICYDIATGELRYNPLFMIDKNKGDLLIDKQGREGILIPQGTMPSLMSMISDAKNAVIGQATKTPGNWLLIRKTIKGIEQHKPNILNNQELIAKTVAKESCMKSFQSLTGYTLPQDLSKQNYQNSQVYVLYDIMNRTFNNPKMKASDIYKLKYLLESFVPIINTYKNPSNTLKKNTWNKQLSSATINQQKSNITGPKIGDGIDKSLSFYTLFNQYIDNTTDSIKSDYRTLNIHKIEAGLSYYTTHGYLEDRSLVASIEKKEKSNADQELENTFKLWS